MKKNVLFFLIFILLSITACVGSFANGSNENGSKLSSTGGDSTMKIKIDITSNSGNHTLTATLADNKSAIAFYELLKKGEVSVAMHDYGSFEKVGSLGTSLPRTDTQITTSAGDIILYQGNQITIYYDVNSWNFTRLGKVDNVSQAELKRILGAGNVTAIFSILQ